jgi:hypothetical protein
MLFDAESSLGTPPMNQHVRTIRLGDEENLQSAVTLAG